MRNLNILSYIISSDTHEDDIGWNLVFGVWTLIYIILEYSSCEVFDIMLLLACQSDQIKQEVESISLEIWV